MVLNVVQRTSPNTMAKSVNLTFEVNIMSHHLSIRVDGTAEMAYTGAAPWHGLGSQLTAGADLDTWRKEAGMNWVVKESELLFSRFDEATLTPSIQAFPDRKVLYRSDTGVPLSVMSKDYNIVQPAEVIEFFRDLTEKNGMVLSTAGCLFGGARFWALAETGNEFQPIEGDTTKGYLLFVTTIDGSMANTAKFVATRVVCNNTMAVALNEKGKTVVRKTHRSIWDPAQVKLDLGLLNSSWEVFTANLNALAHRKMSDDQVKKFFQSTFYDPKKDEESQTSGDIKRVNNLMGLYRNGDGAQYDYGTALGALNAVTNLFTHGTGRQRSNDRKFMSAYFDDSIKSNVMEKLLATC